MKIIIVVGARPNFIKAAPIIRELNLYDDIDYLFVHTGQHYDDNMSEAFFIDLDLPAPDINMCVKSGSHATQTSEIMVKFEKICLSYYPDIVIIIGDVNSSLACAIAASKINSIKIAHIEAGPRVKSQYFTPEEKNRRVIDVLSDYLFASNDTDMSNLKNESVNGKIYLTGDIISDSLLRTASKIEYDGIRTYALLTLHRPFNVDECEPLESILKGIQKASQEIQIIFPIHPRTKSRIEKFGLTEYLSGVTVIDPLGYVEFIRAMRNAKMVITDSGGIQIESTMLNIPCITLMNESGKNTTIDKGTNILAGSDGTKIHKYVVDILNSNTINEFNDELCDGKVASRIVNILRDDNKE